MVYCRNSTKCTINILCDTKLASAQVLKPEKNDVTTGKSAQFSVFFWAKFLKNHLLQEIFLRNEVLKIFCERDILQKLLCSKGLVTRDANSWSEFLQ